MTEPGPLLDRLCDLLSAVSQVQHWEVFTGERVELSALVSGRDRPRVMPHSDFVVSVTTVDGEGDQRRATTSLRPLQLPWLWRQLELPGDPPVLVASTTRGPVPRWDLMEPDRVKSSVEAVHDRLLADSRVRSASVLSVHAWESVAARSSTSVTAGSDTRRRTRLHCDVTCGDATRLDQVNARLGVTDQLYLDDRQLNDTIEEALTAVSRTQRAVEHREAAGTVVFAESTAASLLHELCGHPLEADVYLRPGSIFSGRLGDRVAPQVLSVFDDPRIPGHWGSYAADDQGTAASETCLIHEGRLHSVMTDSATLQAGGKLTGNARRSGMRGPVMPRMSNTVVAAGTDSQQSLVEGVADGWLVTRLGNAECNPSTGKFAIKIEQAQRIRRGQLEEHVRGSVVVGEIGDTLARIEGVARETSRSDAVCVKAGQRVPVGFVAPAVSIADLQLGAT